MNNSVTILVESKKTYTNELLKILRPRLYEGFKSIYEDILLSIKKELEENQIQRGSLTSGFQKVLKEIPQWNQDTIKKEYARILKLTPTCDYFDELVEAVFVINTKILTSVQINSKKAININVTIPQSSHFIHKCYIKTANEIYKNPYIFDVSKSLTSKEKHSNVRDALSMIETGIHNAISDLLPFRDILKQGLTKNRDSGDDEASEESGDDEASQREDASDASDDDGESDDEDDASDDDDEDDDASGASQKEKKNRMSKKEVKGGMKDDTENGMKDDTENGMKDDTENGMKDIEIRMKDDTEIGMKEDSLSAEIEIKADSSSAEIETNADSSSAEIGIKADSASAETYESSESRESSENPIQQGGSSLQDVLPIVPNRENTEAMEEDIQSIIAEQETDSDIKEIIFNSSPSIKKETDKETDNGNEILSSSDVKEIFIGGVSNSKEKNESSVKHSKKKKHHVIKPPHEKKDIQSFYKKMYERNAANLAKIEESTQRAPLKNTIVLDSREKDDEDEEDAPIDF